MLPQLKGQDDLKALLEDCTKSNPDQMSVLNSHTSKLDEISSTLPVLKEVQEDLRQLKGDIFRIFTKEMEVLLLCSTSSVILLCSFLFRNYSDGWHINKLVTILLICQYVKSSLMSICVGSVSYKHMSWFVSFSCVYYLSSGSIISLSIHDIKQ
jgi:uncharacterized membrane protein SirB2